jgi:hypothetical protein
MRSPASLKKSRKTALEFQGETTSPNAVRLSLEIFLAGASVVDTSGGRVDTPQWPGVFGPTGVLEQGVGTRGVLGNLRDPVVSVVDCRLESRLPKLQVDPQLTSRAGGDEKRTKRRYRQAKLAIEEVVGMPR